MCNSRFYSFFPHFNPRSPRGERRFYVISSAMDKAFQSTLPAGGATIPIFRPGLLIPISIHAPRGGSDRFCRFLLSILPKVHFNPRSPRGERLCIGIQPRLLDTHFNPRSPRGERLTVGCLPAALVHFNPRSPRGERHVKPDDYCSFGEISIHAPRGGSDSKSACFLCENLSIYHKFCTQIFLKAFPPLLST